MSAMKPVNQVGCAWFIELINQYKTALYGVVSAGISQEQNSDLNQTLLVL
jgi:hypothetical protein